MSARCAGCGEVSGQPFTVRGYCPACADVACQVGDGDMVGLPVPQHDGTLVSAAMDNATAVLRWHWDHCAYGGCLVCALGARSLVCGECEETPGEDDEDHAMVGAWVAICCEGYVGAAVRAAAVAEPRRNA